MTRSLICWSWGAAWQVKHISLATRLSYAKIVIALDEENQEEVQRVVTQELGGKSKYMRADICYRITAFWSDRDTRDITGGRNIAEFMVRPCSTLSALEPQAALPACVICMNVLVIPMCASRLGLAPPRARTGPRQKIQSFTWRRKS